MGSEWAAQCLQNLNLPVRYHLCWQKGWGGGERGESVEKIVRRAHGKRRGRPERGREEGSGKELTIAPLHLQRCPELTEICS